MRRSLALRVLALLAPLPLAAAQDLPEFRPALIGTSPEAMINRIDENFLVKAQQKDATLLFYALVDKTGEIKWSATQGGADSMLLEKEVQRVLVDGKMIPAIAHHQLVGVFYYGTVIFRTINGKPRLRIFANQEKSELAKESDFVGPQLYIGPGSSFSGLHYPADQAPVPVSGAVELALKIDDSGNVLDVKVVEEHPPLLGFGQAALDDLSGAKCIPAFRNGQPVACEITLPLYYQSKN